MDEGDQRAHAFRATAGIMALLLACPASAHDFWIQPASFRLHAGQTANLRFLIGESDMPEHWEMAWQKVISLQDFAPTGVIDALARIEPDDADPPAIERLGARLPMLGTGTHMVAFTSNQSFNSLAADKFVEYALQEGLSLPLAERAAKGETDRPGRELYSRRAKALIQVGRRITDTVSAPIGQTLEIVPEVNPYGLRAGQPLRVRVWFHGAPLSGARLALQRLDVDASPAAQVSSDADGRATFNAPGKGSWKINVLWSYPIVDARADYETIFCSLTFGY